MPTNKFNESKLFIQILAQYTQMFFLNEIAGISLNLQFKI